MFFLKFFLKVSLKIFCLVILEIAPVAYDVTHVSYTINNLQKKSTVLFAIDDVTLKSKLETIIVWRVDEKALIKYFTRKNATDLDHSSNQVKLGEILIDNF